MIFTRFTRVSPTCPGSTVPLYMTVTTCLRFTFVVFFAFIRSMLNVVVPRSKVTLVVPDPRVEKKVKFPVSTTPSGRVSVTMMLVALNTLSRFLTVKVYSTVPLVFTKNGSERLAILRSSSGITNEPVSESLDGSSSIMLELVI